jgi:DNA-binding MarR family transcriptional regulator
MWQVILPIVGGIGLAIVSEGRKQGNLAKKAEKLPPHAQEFSGSMTGQSTQIMVRNLLSQYSELSVKQIAQALSLSNPTVQKCLYDLMKQGVVARRRYPYKNRYYYHLLN